MTPSEQERAEMQAALDMMLSLVPGKMPELRKQIAKISYYYLLSLPADVPPLPEGFVPPFRIATHRDCCDEYISCVVDANGRAVNSFEEKWVDPINHTLNAIYGKEKQ